MSQEEKAERRAKCGPLQDPSFMKQFQAMLDEGGSDCARMMSRMRAMCCETPKESEEPEEPVNVEKS